MRLADFREYDPHHLLGLHDTSDGQIIRLWRPGSDRIYLEVKGFVHEAVQEDPAGLFTFAPKEKIEKTDYRIYHADGTLAADPYAFPPFVGEMDLYLWNSGCHYQPYRFLGANLRKVDGIEGIHFAVWAPNAKAVSLVGDFNFWDGKMNPMRSLGISGVWELFVPGIGNGMRYKFEIRTQWGETLMKSDPFASFAEVRPGNASVVFATNRHRWKDQKWMQQREAGVDRPLNIYEVHLGSWRNNGGGFRNYRELAKELGDYAVDMGFSHVELLPIMEHPFDDSWGYQVTGFYAATSRFGTPEDFQWFVDHLHQRGIGVILDWVPAHFPFDDFSLVRFDGTALYEHEDPKKGLHPHWSTAIFNLGRKEVSNFLLGSALFWLEEMHVDGLRVDAVASLLYLDYGRKEGEWIPNPDGSNYNLEAIEFIKHLNSIVRQRFPSALMIAEESSAYADVTKPVEWGGLGFHLKWNLGWMNDTLRYFSKDPVYRKYHQNDLTFSLLYAFSERFLLVLSHDEVVHLKGSLIGKMPGPDWQKFANVRLLYSYQIGHPGKKLLFMGGELGQWSEWDCNGELEWHLLQYPLHQGLQNLVRQLNHFYLAHPALWRHDFDWAGYEWIDFNDADRSVIAYLRKGDGELLAFVHNFTPEVHENYWVPLVSLKNAEEVFNTDAEEFGGSGVLNQAIQIEQGSGFTVRLAPLATMIFKITC